MALEQEWLLNLEEQSSTQEEEKAEKVLAYST